MSGVYTSINVRITAGGATQKTHLLWH